MAYAAKVLTDSTNNLSDRLTTFEITYPRMVHAEHLRHRTQSMNVGSSRAIPTAKIIEQVQRDPVMPVFWGKLQKGMSASDELEGDALLFAQSQWLEARDAAVEYAGNLLDGNVHKQILNRILEPWMWVTVLCSATEWMNFFALRSPTPEAESYRRERGIDPLFPAQPEIQKIARMMEDVYYASTPVAPDSNQYAHLPLFGFEGDDAITGMTQIDHNTVVSTRMLVSAGRCARTSYLTHEGTRDVDADIELALSLIKSRHWSPMEHQATPMYSSRRSGNFQGWKQFRQSFVGQDIARR